MSLFWSLLKVQLKQQLRPSKKSRWGYLAYPLVALAFIPFALMVVELFAQLTELGTLLGVPAMGLQVGTLAAMVTALIFGLTYLLSSIYYANDLTRLIPLPIRPGAILLAKFSLVYLGELVTLAAIMGPAAIGYAQAGLAEPLFWPRLVLIWLLLPAIPLSLATILAMLLMGLTNRKPNKDVLRTVGTLFMVVAILAVQAASQYLLGPAGALSQGGDEALAKLVAEGGLLDLMGRYFPPSLWATRGLVGSLRDLGLFALACGLAFLIVSQLAERLFFKGVVGAGEGGRYRATSERQLAASFAGGRTPLRAAYWREWTLFNRNPIFLQQGLLPVVIVPVAMALPLVLQGDLQTILATLRQGQVNPLYLLLGSLAIQALLVTNSLASTAISREGRFFWLARALPLAPRVQVQAKLLHSLTIGAVYVLLPLLGAAWLFAIHLSDLLIVLALNLGAAVVSIELGLFVDLTRPKLNWSDPLHAMKNNVNSLLNLALHAIFLALLCGLGYLLWPRANHLTVSAILLATVVAAALALYQPLLRYADRRYAEVSE